MPSATRKKKAFKPWSRQTRKLRRLSTQASPASSSHPRGDIAPPRLILSNDVILACTGTLRAQEQVEKLGSHAAHIVDGSVTLKNGTKDSTQR